MLDWISLAPPVLTAVALLMLLGGPVAFALRLRGFALAIVTIPAACAILAISAVVAPFAALPWNVLPPFALTVVLSLILFIMRPLIAPPRTLASREQDPRRRFWLPLGAAAIGGLALTTTFILAMKQPDAVSQTYDANFHLNAVRLILDSGNASPLAMDLASPGDPSFYPTLWHGFVTLIAQISGASIPLATNAALFTVGAVVWTIGMVAFGRAIGGPSARVTVISGVLSAAIPSFPLALTGYGVLYPNLLSLALVPYILVGAMQLLGLARARRSEVSSLGVAWLLTLGAIGAATFGHPNAIHIVLLWAIGPAIACFVRAFRSARVGSWNGETRAALLHPTARRVLSVFGLVGLIAGFAGAWHIGRTADNPWSGKHNIVGATLDAVGMSPHLEGHAWPVAILLVFGVIVAVRLPHMRWLIVSGIVLVGVYVLADGFDASTWRTTILSPWYSDPWRLAALAPLGAFPLIVLGASKAWSIVRMGVFRWAHMTQRPRRSRGYAIAAATIFLLAATQGAGAHAGVQYASEKYEAVDNAPLLSDTERALIDRLPEHLPDDAVIINNPWNGGALAYALTGYPVLTPHTGGSYDPRIQELTTELAEGTAEACALVSEFGAEFVLDFGQHYVFAGTPRAEPYAGITAIEESPVLTEIDREADAVLYQVTGCSS